MPLTPFIRTEKAARKVLGDTGLFDFHVGQRMDRVRRFRPWKSPVLRRRIYAGCSSG